MPAIGGSIEAVSLSGREFPVSAESTVNRKLGGTSNEIKMNGNKITGRLIKTSMAWVLSGLDVEIYDSRNDQEYLQELADRKGYFAVAVTYASGLTYQGDGQLIEDVEMDSQNATAGLTLSGPGTLTQQ